MTTSIRATPETIWGLLTDAERYPAWNPTVTRIWVGGMALGFLFKGVRTFTLSPRSDGAVDFTMREAFSGLLAPLIGRAIPDLQLAFDDFAAALKREAER